MIWPEVELHAARDEIDRCRLTGTVSGRRGAADRSSVKRSCWKSLMKALVAPKALRQIMNFRRSPLISIPHRFGRHGISTASWQPFRIVPIFELNNLSQCSAETAARPFEGSNERRRRSRQEARARVERKRPEITLRTWMMRGADHRASSDRASTDHAAQITMEMLKDSNIELGPATHHWTSRTQQPGDAAAIRPEMTSGS